MRKAHIVVANDKLKVTVVCLGVKFSFYQRDGKIILYYISQIKQFANCLQNLLRIQNPYVLEHNGNRIGNGAEHDHIAFFKLAVGFYGNNLNDA